MQKITLRTSHNHSVLIGFWYSDEEKEKKTAVRDLNYYSVKSAFSKLLDIINQTISLSDIERDFYERELHFSMEETEDLEVTLLENVVDIIKLFDGKHNGKNASELTLLLASQFESMISEERVKLKETLLISKIDVSEKMLSSSLPVICC